ncbi:hydrogenobyrinic acid a,c-diamide synthase (glutamine-hydrolysing) /cobyrinate a,c-diamide synthase [Paenibacillus cellulosilyticus]|uniref:Cobyrinate a,c-diamide synthase n=1 Tax=Paenibacillus cellulosilyticus TaxID=375489 RepID=A0A2V2YVM1_9BACL|nr:cobyrinate a,c-diamide synthase [Paenibacillus cellulosilyticus]PWW03265.1 hydrogenobyrinic acid a,c-diamide synthase (glutamine-hydrolysing) /cobyrinate a,c-diamide synthase [Paenibacillus cellulosilyticus]QKS43745.1 cobyrinate a,c-diamide synthase [Paenibacillus cellulosilyticus]
MTRSIVIAGPGSGEGKTTVAIGLMAAYRSLGYVVQGFKCGPDYIDPTYHTAVTGRPSRNVDSWMCAPAAARELFERGAQGADIAIVEGVMGMFDGKEPLSNEGSTAAIAKLIGCPVLLVIDCSGMARSAAAIVQGFQSFDPEVRIAGVVANKVGSRKHFEMIQKAVEQMCGIPVVGFLEQGAELVLPERHLGLVPSIERGELTPFFELLSERVRSGFALDRLLDAMGTISSSTDESSLFIGNPSPPKVKIAVARDEAFSFYYPDNLELLTHYGAEIVPFSPLHGEPVPEDADGLYLGGGFPEEFAETLSQQTEALESIRLAVRRGLPTLAECGGFMVLTEEIVTRSGAGYPMAGIIPGRVRMQGKLAAFGYREITGVPVNFLIGSGEQARGHEFHYSVYEPEGHDEQPLPYAYITKGMYGQATEGFAIGNLAAGYTHIHFGSAPWLAKRWIDACLKMREQHC